MDETTTNAAADTDSRSAASDVLTKIEGNIHHLDLLPSNLAIWFKAKLAELRAIISPAADASTATEAAAAPAADAEPVAPAALAAAVTSGLADAGHAADVTVEHTDEGTVVKATRAADGAVAPTAGDATPAANEVESFVGRMVGFFKREFEKLDDKKASEGDVQAQTITAITDGVNAGLNSVYPGTTSIKTDDAGYVVSYNRTADNLTSGATTTLAKGSAEQVSAFVSTTIQQIQAWYASYDAAAAAKANAPQ
jgi:hypothetical protein